MRLDIRTDHAEPLKNEVWSSVDRHADYMFAMEHDAWQSMPLRRVGPGSHSAEITLPVPPRTLDVVGRLSAHDEWIDADGIEFAGAGGVPARGKGD